MELSKGENNRFPLEGLILYFVLFFPGIYATGFSGEIEPIGTIPFSTVRELGRTLTYTIPSLALLWYLISDRKQMTFSSLIPKNLRKKVLFPFTIGLPGLILIGLGISLLISLFSQAQGPTPPPKVEAPGNIWGWIVMVFSCLGTGYLEESYFRYYLLTRLRRQLPEPAKRIILSTLLFSLCHIYEGPWGVLNALLAGILLSALFIRYRSLHGIAWAHGAYNIFVYAMGHFI